MQNQDMITAGILKNINMITVGILKNIKNPDLK